MRIHSKYFLQDIRKKYNITDLISQESYVYYRIKKGTYGLKQADCLAYNTLVDNLKKEGYIPDKYYPNIWGHETRDTNCCLWRWQFRCKIFQQERCRSSYKRSPKNNTT